MGNLLEFIETVRSYWESAVILFLVAVLTWVFGYLYAAGSGSDEVPWYVSVIIFLSFFPVMSYHMWLTQKRQHAEEVQNLKDQLDMRARRREQRETLARFLTTGMQIRKRYEALNLLPSGTTVKEWDTEVCTYLHLTFGYDYAILFQRPLGPHEYDLNKRPSHIAEENYPTYLFFNMRFARLEKLIEELKD